MKIEMEEFKNNYGSYEFGYKVWCIPETEDSLSDIYQRGFLPYSGHQYGTPRYYLCRSARIPLQIFTPNSENRRILKKFDGMIDVQEIPAVEVFKDERFISMALKYFENRHGPGIMTRERLQTICSYSDYVRAQVYSSGGKVVAYVLEHRDGDIGHYWFSFYDLSFAFQSFGMWLMVDYVRTLCGKGLLYAYLGTVYGSRALYKTNFPHLEFWDGTKWNSDIQALKKLAREEAK